MIDSILKMNFMKWLYILTFSFNFLAAKIKLVDKKPIWILFAAIGFYFFFLFWKNFLRKEGHYIGISTIFSDISISDSAMALLQKEFSNPIPIVDETGQAKVGTAYGVENKDGNWYLASTFDGDLNAYLSLNKDYTSVVSMIPLLKLNEKYNIKKIKTIEDFHVEKLVGFKLYVNKVEEEEEDDELY